MEFLKKYERYCSLVDEFLGDDYRPTDRSRFTGEKIRDYMFELKKVLYEFTSDEMSELFRRAYSHLSIKTLAFYTGAYKKFINFAMTKKDLHITKNIMLEKRMTPKALYDEHSRLHYYGDDEISAICSRIDLNRPYYETIIRIIYENVVPSIESAVRIKIQDVDLANKTIMVNGTARPISYKLADAIRRMLKLDKFEAANRKIPFVHRFDTLIPLMEYSKRKAPDEESYFTKLSHNSSRAVTRIKDLDGDKLTVTAIFNSGIVNCIIEGFDSDDLFRLFNDEDVRKGSRWKREMSGKITDYLKEKGYSDRTARFGDIKYCYQAYMRKEL